MGSEDKKIKNWNDFHHKEQVYSLSHLCEFEWTYTQAAKGANPERKYKFTVEFGLHCFTYAPNKNKGETLNSFPKDLNYSDSRETRIFCFKRWKLSFRLQDIAKDISQKHCYNTGKGNFFTIELINENTGDVEEYEIYFKVSRDKKGWLRLFVQSAYIRDQSHGTTQPDKKKIGFFIIAKKVQEKKTIQ